MPTACWNKPRERAAQQQPPNPPQLQPCLIRPQRIYPHLAPPSGRHPGRFAFCALHKAIQPSFHCMAHRCCRGARCIVALRSSAFTSARASTGKPWRKGIAPFVAAFRCAGRNSTAAAHCPSTAWPACCRGRCKRKPPTRQPCACATPMCRPICCTARPRPARLANICGRIRLKLRCKPS